MKRALLIWLNCNALEPVPSSELAKFNKLHAKLESSTVDFSVKLPVRLPLTNFHRLDRKKVKEIWIGHWGCLRLVTIQTWQDYAAALLFQCINVLVHCMQDLKEAKATEIKALNQKYASIKDKLKGDKRLFDGTCQ